MSWTTLGNGVCPPPPPEGLRFVAASSGYSVNMAIDNVGRMYAWGDSYFAYQGQTPVVVPATPNFTRHPATFRVSPVASYLPYPYQIGYPKSDWVDCQTIEYLHMALDASGHLYAVGDDGTGPSVFGRGGWAATSKYNISTGVTFVPGGEQAIVMTLVNDQQWERFVLGHYHVLAQKADKSLWIWGKNLDNATYGSLSYVVDYVSITPIEMTWVPGPVKCFDAAYSVTAIVTESNQVYAWGDWANTAIGLEQIPVQIPFTLPLGTTIIDLKCNYSGILILLSNGDAYGIGWYIGGTQPAEAMVFTKLLGGHTFTKIFASMDTGAAALDTNGVLWAWGNQSYLIVQGGVDDIVTGTPSFTGGPDPSNHHWVNFAAGNITHLAIDDKGRLFSWGSDYLGMQGLGLYTDNPASVTRYEAVECGAFATLDSGVLAYEEQAASSPSGLIIRIPIPKQLAAHDSCGHWHKGGGSTAREEHAFAANCWEPTIATDGSRVLYVIAGRHRPNELYVLVYYIASNVWSTPLFRTDILHSNWDGSASIAGDVLAYHNYAYDITGEQYNEITSNPRTVTYVTGVGGYHVKEWPGSIELHGRNKVAVNADGKVACIIRTGTNFFVQGSTNFGSSYTSIYTLPVSTTDACVVINPNDGLVYIAAVEQSTDTLRVYSGSISGTGWTLKSTTTVVDAPTTLRFHVDGTRFFVVVYNSFYYSTNNCASFTRRDLHDPSSHFAATGTLLYNLSENQDWRTDNYEDTVISWDQALLGGTPIDRATIHNAGQLAVYSQATLRDDASEGNIVTILLSHNLGTRWEVIKTPLNYYETFEETLNLNDNPVWPFVPQYAKF